MRVVYYFNPAPNDESLNRLIAKILGVYEEYELVYATGNRYLGTLARLSLPVPEKPTLIIINNGALDGVWGLTNG